jgi:serine/threonine protein kinase
MISSNQLFCDECGAANISQAAICFACKQPLSNSPVSSSLQPAVRNGTLNVSHPLSPGFLLAQRYAIIRQVGQGGFGVVYKARDRKSKNRLVAIKQINLGMLSSREMIEVTDTYNREVVLLSKLRHKNLPRIYDHFTDPAHWYVVMDFIRGETLEDYLARIRRGHLSVKQVIKTGITLSGVLSYLHTRIPPVIFRDVKPANIMRTRRGHLYLIDFGIARRFTPGKKKDTGPLGSPGYAAPEQYGKAQTTAQTDIYGLGATLKTLLTGKDPLDRAGGTQSVSHPKIPPNLQALLDRMLEQDMNQRPSSMERVKEQLELMRRKIMWVEDRALAYAKGLLYGLFPSILILLPIYLVSLLSPIYDLIPSFLFPLFYLLTPLMLLIFIGQWLYAIHCLFFPGKRLMGLGMLTVFVLIFLVIKQGWL